MDCRTARLLLEYAHPGAGELAPTESAALDDHLASCEACEQLAGGERRADEAVGKAMRQVDVPDQLRGRILDRLKAGRNDRRRRWVAYGACGAAAAAAVVLLTLGAWHWYTAPQAFPAEKLVVLANSRVITPPDAHDIEAALKGQGVAMEAPTDLDYSRLRWLFLTTVEGRQTPLLIFNKTSEDGTRPQHALVFLLADDQFDLNALAADAQKKDANAYEYKWSGAVLHPSGGKRSGYVVYYTGDDWDWLKRRLGQPETANGN